ncbi:unnamed protein product [Brassica rapa]|uniref:Uncharacterized protein n=1 Tax=Brassica campestris TaxID=3711 RepID=A0A8D9GIQ6_BRACM|nr:unnamed protein product [Brassica rapa]
MNAHQWRKAQESFLLSASLKLDNDACAKTNFMTIPCWKDLIRLKIDHCYKIVEITDNPGKYLLD